MAVGNLRHMFYWFRLLISSPLTDLKTLFVVYLLLALLNHTLSTCPFQIYYHHGLTLFKYCKQIFYKDFIRPRAKTWCENLQYLLNSLPSFFFFLNKYLYKQIEDKSHNSLTERQTYVYTEPDYVR